MIGTVVRLIHQKNFGFIRAKDGEEYFFHRTSFNGHWQDLSHDHAKGKFEIKVSFDISAEDKKGPRAENVMRLDHPNRGD